MSLPTHCVDCKKKLPSTFRMISRNPPVGICPTCNKKRLTRRDRLVNTWMHLHAREIALPNVPIDVIKYCSQAFDNWDGDIGYHVPKHFAVETRAISIGPSLLRYGTTCGGINNKFDMATIKYLVQHSSEEYVVAEVISDPDPEIQNMAVRWKTVTGQIVDSDGDLISMRDYISYQFSDLVYGFGGSLRPDCCDYDRWDTFESE